MKWKVPLHGRAFTGISRTIIVMRNIPESKFPLGVGAHTTPKQLKIVPGDSTVLFVSDSLLKYV